MSIVTDMPRGSDPKQFVRKEPCEVEMILVDGTEINGEIFLSHDERVSDMLNDGRRFFAIRQLNHEVLLISKDAVAICKPLDKPG